MRVNLADVKHSRIVQAVDKYGRLTDDATEAVYGDLELTMYNGKTYVVTFGREPSQDAMLA